MNEKIDKYLNDENYVNKITNEYISKQMHTKTINLCVNTKPEAYARPRVVRGGKHSYNPKADKMDNAHKILLHQAKKEDLELIKSLNDDYTVELDLKYYIKIPETDSIKNTILKEKGLLRPITRPDLDNYDKFIIDVLHDIVFDDDKRVISVTSGKYYSLNPRTEIIATIHYNS